MKTLTEIQDSTSQSEHLCKTPLKILLVASVVDAETIQFPTINFTHVNLETGVFNHKVQFGACNEKLSQNATSCQNIETRQH